MDNKMTMTTEDLRKMAELISTYGVLGIISAVRDGADVAIDGLPETTSKDAKLLASRLKKTAVAMNRAHTSLYEHTNEDLDEAVAGGLESLAESTGGDDGAGLNK